MYAIAEASVEAGVSGRIIKRHCDREARSCILSRLLGSVVRIRLQGFVI